MSNLKINDFLALVHLSKSVIRRQDMDSPGWDVSETQPIIKMRVNLADAIKHIGNSNLYQDERYSEFNKNALIASLVDSLSYLVQDIYKNFGEVSLMNKLSAGLQDIDELDLGFEDLNSSLHYWLESAIAMPQYELEEAVKLIVKMLIILLGNTTAIYAWWICLRSVDIYTANNDLSIRLFKTPQERRISLINNIIHLVDSIEIRSLESLETYLVEESFKHYKFVEENL